MNILNKDKEILESLVKKINDADEIFIAVSFITRGGLDCLIKKTDLLKKKVKFITTTENFITDHWTLKMLYKNKIATSIINASEETRSFHSKFIIFKKGNSIESMTGSLNLTNNAFFNKFESVIFQSEDSSSLENFDYLFSYGEILTKDFIDDYEFRFNAYKKQYDDFVNDLRIKVNLRPNEMQERVLTELQSVRAAGHNRALLWAATGTGKTYLSAFDAKKNEFNKLLFIVHNRTIIKNAKRDFENIFFDKSSIELFTHNKRFVNDNEICFTTEKTVEKILSKDKDFLNQFDYVIFDEAHKMGEKNIQGEIFRKIKDRKDIFILGMTATPNRSDNPAYLIEQFRNVVGKIDTKEAIGLKLICKFNYYGADVDVDFEAEDLANNDLNLMVDKFVEELKKRKTWDGSKIKGLIFVSNINEAEKVSEMVTEKGYKSYPVHSQSNTDSDMIGNYIDDLQNESKDLSFIVTVNKFNEGVDIPHINTIGMFRFTESNIIYTQQIGRGLRIAGNENKRLNIIDLVGNHNNNYERIVGLNGSTLMNPKEVIERVYQANEKFENSVEFELTEKSRQNILNSLGSMSYNKYFKEKLFEVSKIYQKEITLLDIEEVLDETIQIISNNLRSKKTHNYGDKSWVSIALESAGKKIEDITKEEHQILELFSWMPFTTSTPAEKQKILNLANGERVNLTAKWVSYFTGNNINNKSISQLVKGDFSKWFEYDGTNIKFHNNLESRSSSDIFNQIKQYISNNLNRDDKLVADNWYSKAEVGFMAGYTANVMTGKFKKYKQEKEIDENDLFLTNTVSKKGGTLYENKVLERNKFIVSNDGMSEMEYPYQIHNFLGKELFNKSVLYKYVGKPTKFRKHDVKRMNPNTHSEYKDIASDKEYQRFNISTDTRLNDRDYYYFLLGVN